MKDSLFSLTELYMLPSINGSGIPADGRVGSEEVMMVMP